jgi:glycosyltransferase involved in cell wall biosynthesis
MESICSSRRRSSSKTLRFPESTLLSYTSAVVFALDATPLAEPTGGIARYTWELARSLAELYPDDDYWLFSDQTFAMAVDRPRNLHGGARPQSPFDRRWWLWGLPRELQRHNVDLFHGTDFSVPYVSRRPSIMTVHDLSPWMSVNWNHATSRVKRRTPLLLRLGLATLVITPSQAIRRAVIDRFALPPSNVVAVPLAARAFFRPVDVAPATTPYFLFVGTLEARKNVARLIEAWRNVRAERDVELWLVGRQRAGYDLPPPEPGLRYLGSVDDADLPELYSSAVAFVYPSLYEGFGLPVLEAMQCGCPVIGSTDPAIVEVSGDAAVHPEAEDTDALAHAMRTVLDQPEQRVRMRDAGLVRAARFHWRETARLTREAYVEALR